MGPIRCVLSGAPLLRNTEMSIHKKANKLLFDNIVVLGGGSQIRVHLGLSAASINMFPEN